MKPKFKSVATITWLFTAAMILVTGSIFYIFRLLFFENFSIRIMLFIMCGMLILSDLLCARLAARFLSKPLGDAEKFVKKIANKEWSDPLEVSSEHEIGRIFSMINDLQEALKKSDEIQHEFFNSISHDLKTPTMVIMSHADAILDGIYIDSLENTARIIKDESMRLNKKVNHLVYLSSLDYILQNRPPASLIDLDVILNKIVAKFEIAGSHLTIDKDIEELQVYGDFYDLTIALENIWDNAIRFAKSHVSVSLKKQGDNVRLEMFNDGEHINPQKMDGLFENMYQGKMNNFGLGLSITKKTINFFGGDVWAENLDNGGVRFVIEYPLTPPRTPL